MKSKIPKKYRTGGHLDNHLLAFIWKRQNETRYWDAFLDALSDYEFIE